MSFTRYAKAEATVVEIKGSPTRIKTASLDTLSSYEDYRTQDGYLYARIRAISSRVNKNHDAWPSVELAGDHSLIHDSRVSSGTGFTVEANKDNRYGFSSFLGKPVFVDHNNTNPKRARGVIVDSRLHVEPNTDDGYYKTADCHESFKPATWVELLLEIDAKTFPRLAKAIIDGSKDPSRGIDGFSMGANVERSICSHCANVATAPDEFCKHIAHKGAYWDHKDPKTGRKTSKRSFEFCEGVQFFEISAVFDPADETALIREVRSGVLKESADPAECLEAMSNPNDPRTHTPPTGGIMCPQCGGEGYDAHGQKCAMCGGTGRFEGTPASDGAYGIGRLGPDDATVAPYDPSINPNFGPVHQGSVHVAEGVENIQAELLDAPSAVADPKVPWAWVDDPEKREWALARVFARAKASGDHDTLRRFLDQSGLSKPVIAKVAQKLADDHNQIPQFDMKSAPTPIDPLQSPLQCPVCGAEVTGEECDVCHWTRPPEGFGNPDIDAAKQNVQNRLHGDDIQAEDAAVPQDQSALQDPNNPPVPPPPHRNLAPVSQVTGEMGERWRVIEAGKINTVEVPIRSGTKPATNEPNETIVRDQATPVTSSVRTAADFLSVAAALTNTGENMKTADATSQAPDAAKPKTQVDVTGTGGVDEASNEAASKADRQVNVLDHGGVDSDVAADSHETLPDSSGEGDAGFNTDHTTEDSGPTKTWSGTGPDGDSLGQHEPVTNDPYPASDQGVKQGHNDGMYPAEDGGLSGGGAQKGNEPIDPSFKAMDRVDVTDHVTSPSNNSGPTKTWSGTDGNGVNKQQDPVTQDKQDNWNTVTKGSSAHLFSAFKLADLEVEIGLITAASKYERIAELENEHPAIVEASLRYANRVKTANLRSQAKVASRMPSLAKAAATPAKEAAADPYAVTLPGEEDFAAFL
jgi:hypothetical protein